MLNIKYHNKKTNKKMSKKNRERTDVHGCAGIGGGWVYPAHANTRNGVNGDIQRFATLVCSVAGAFDRSRIKQRRVYSVHGEGKKEVSAYLIISSNKRMLYNILLCKIYIQKTYYFICIYDKILRYL